MQHLLRLLLCACGLAGAQSQSVWWRLVCNAALLDTWRLCDITYFDNFACSSTLAAPAQETLPTCLACSPGEATITARFGTAVEVRCLTYSACSTTTNPAIGSGFGGLLQGTSQCSQVALESSADGSSWTSVGQWSNPQPGDQLVRSGGGTPAPGNGGNQGVSSNLYVVRSQPLRVQNCGACFGDGAQARSILTLEFSEAVQFGSGEVVISRGSLNEVRLPTSSSWLSISGKNLRISPQVDLAGSGECTTITLQQDAINTLSGQMLPQDEQSHFCIVDSQPPQVASVDGWSPPDDTVVVQVRPEIKVTFMEEVLITQNSAPALLARVGANVTESDLEFAPSDSRVDIWNPLTRAAEVVFRLPVDLQQDSQYIFTVPSGFVKDRWDNAWSGGTLRFRTESFNSQDDDDGDANGGSGGGSGGSGGGVVLGIVAVLVVLCCCGAAFTGWVCYLRSSERKTKTHRAQAWSQPPPTTAHKNSAGSFQSAASAQSQGGNNGGASPPGHGFDKASEASSPGWSPYTPNSAPPPQGPRRAAQAGGDASPGGMPGEQGGRRHSDGTPDLGSAKLPKANGQTFAERQATRAAEQQARAPPPRPRAYEAEDVHNSRRGAGPGPHRPQPTSFTEDDAAGGEWIKAIDKATGRPYWYHCRTMETRWERPVRGRDDQGPSKAEAERPKTQSGQKLGPDLANLEEAEEVARVKADLLEQLRKNRKEDLALRKKTFKFMCFQWHPDKNQDKPELATPVFQFLQEQRGWFLEESNTA